MDSKKDLLNYSRGELETELRDSFGLEPYRARQLIRWVYRDRSQSFEPMTDISKTIRDTLAQAFTISRPEKQVVRISSDGTRKYLFRLADGESVETVLICQPKRYTLCVSSQVGCAIGCKFCRTGLMGLKRHLKTAEIVGQVLAVQDDVAQWNLENPSASIPEFQNIVFMGMGEPLHNIENVTRAVCLLNDNLGFNFSGRKITVSTSGLVPAIQQFGQSPAKANLAISLNATTDEVRTQLIPINRRWPLADLLKALREYPLAPGRRVTIEYVMLAGVNDTDADLQRLPKLLVGIPSKVNLIPYNNNTGLGFKSPSREVIAHWQSRLLERGINATIRWSKGDDISAACGQLATEVVNLKRKASSPSTDQAPLPPRGEGNEVLDTLTAHV